MQLEHRLSVLLQLHLHSQLHTWLQWIERRQLQDETRNIYAWGLGASYFRESTVLLWYAICKLRPSLRFIEKSCINLDINFSHNMVSCKWLSMYKYIRNYDIYAHFNKLSRPVVSGATSTIHHRKKLQQSNHSPLATPYGGIDHTGPGAGLLPDIAKVLP